MRRGATTRSKNDLGEATASARARNTASPRTKGETTAPVFTLRYMQAVGVTKAARELGVSTTLLHKARNNQLVSKVVERASEGLLMHIESHDRGGYQPPSQDLSAAVSHATPGAGAATMLFLIEVDTFKAPILQRTAEALGAKVVIQA